MTPLQYTPGTWQAAVSPHGVAVLPAALDSALIEQVWGALGTGKGFAAVLESLTGAFGTSLAAIPPFAVLTVTADEVRLAVRGVLEIEVRETGAGAAAGYTVSGDDVTTWSERVVRLAAGAPAPALSVRTPDAAAAGASGAGPWLRISDGIVLCSALALEPRAAHAPVAPPVAAPETAAPLAQHAGTADESVHEDEHTIGAADVGDTRTELPDDAYDHLWGATVVKSVEHAAVRDADDPDEDAEAAPAGTPAVGAAPPSEPAPTPAPAPADSAPAAVTDSFAPPAAPASDSRAWTAPPATGLIDSVPGFGGLGASSATGNWGSSAATPAAEPARAPTPAPAAEAAASAPTTASLAPAAPTATPTPAPAPTPAQGDIDHDGLTVTVSELEALRRLSAARGEQAPAPAAGGRMVLSTGDVYPLDSPIIIGRRPRANRVDADRMPVLVTVESPQQDISRNHLEVRIEGRHVLAVDLDTTNGSVLHREGTPPLRLSPHDPVLLLTGDLVDLGDGVTAVFEDLP